MPFPSSHNGCITLARCSNWDNHQSQFRGPNSCSVCPLLSSVFYMLFSSIISSNNSERREPNSTHWPLWLRREFLINMTSLDAFRNALRVQQPWEHCTNTRKDIQYICNWHSLKNKSGHNATVTKKYFKNIILWIPYYRLIYLQNRVVIGQLCENWLNGPHCKKKGY